MPTPRNCANRNNSSAISGQHAGKTSHSAWKTHSNKKPNQLQSSHTPHLALVVQELQDEACDKVHALHIAHFRVLHSSSKQASQIVTEQSRRRSVPVTSPSSANRSASVPPPRTRTAAVAGTPFPPRSARQRPTACLAGITFPQRRKHSVTAHRTDTITPATPTTVATPPIARQRTQRRPLTSHVDDRKRGPGSSAS